MSEHSRGFSAAKWEEYAAACAEASSPRVTLIPGIEYGDTDDVVHVPVWGRLPFFGESPPIGELLAQVSEAGGTAVWAHPSRRNAWARFDPEWRQHLGGVEIWNRKYDGIAPNRRSSELSRQHDVPAFVALDFHTRRQLFPLSLALRLDAPAGGSPDPMEHRAATGPGAVLSGSAPGPGVAVKPRTANATGPIGPDVVYAALRAGGFAPHAFGLPTGPLSSGVPAALLRGLESGRRSAARLVR
jgi:hypothetical protein